MAMLLRVYFALDAPVWWQPPNKVEKNTFIFLSLAASSHWEIAAHNDTKLLCRLGGR